MKKLLATLLAVLALCGCMAVGALAVAEENELAWSQAPDTAEFAAQVVAQGGDIAFGWEEYAEFFSYPVWAMLQTSFAPFCLKDPNQANTLYSQAISLKAEWRGKITSEKALSDYMKALGDLVKPALTKDGKEIFNAYLPSYALVRLIEKAGSDMWTLWEASDEMKALAKEMGISIRQLDLISSYNAGNIDKLKQYFSNVAIVTTRYLKAQGVEFPDILNRLVEVSENYDATILTLWGKQVVMKEWYDWVLLILCFGWIWMAL